MKPLEISLTQELAAYEVAYWREVDHNWGREAHTFYTEEPLFELGGQPLKSRQAIQDFYKWRANRGERTARHVVTNFHAEYLDDGKQAVFECICMLYAADGAPVFPSRPPSATMDVVNLYQRTTEGGWLLRKRILKTIFQGTDPVTIPP